MTTVEIAATMATTAPARPIDFTKPCGKTVRVIMAAATVAAENSTVRPAVRMVTPMASRGSVPESSSSRKRVRTNNV